MSTTSSHTSAGNQELQHPAPFLQFDDFLAPQKVDELLGFVARREGDLGVDGTAVRVGTDPHSARVTQTLYDLGEVWPLFETQLEGLLPAMRKELGVPHFKLQHTERQLAVHFDGDSYGPHNDNGSDATATRGLTYIYYFNRQPRRFEGGELWLYNYVERDGVRYQGTSFDLVEPRHNSIVFFPSWVHHEVRPSTSSVPGLDGCRMTFTGWYHAEETSVEKSEPVIEVNPARRAALQRSKLPKFTENGFAVVATPSKVQDSLLALLDRDIAETAEAETVDWYLEGQPARLDGGPTVEAVGPSLLATLEDWSGRALEHTETSGIWRASGGETVGLHAKQLESQVITSLVCVDGDPWPVHIEDHQRRLQKVVLQPGQMMMFEGATCAYSRPHPFDGNQSTWLEVHYRPSADWAFTEREILSRPP